MMSISHWLERLEDRRSRRVIFLSHCLLNENTRYLGGACRPAIVREAIEFCLWHDIAIVQMPCPEQCAWGGVLKRRLLGFYGVEGSWRGRLGRLVLPVMLWWTRLNYRALARLTASQISDYIASRMEVVAIVGVDGSPSCGVARRLNMKQAFVLLGNLQPGSATRGDVNNVIRSTQTSGAGLYVAALRAELQRRQVRVPFVAHDLLAELDERPLPLSQDLQSALELQ